MALEIQDRKLQLLYYQFGISKRASKRKFSLRHWQILTNNEL